MDWKDAEEVFRLNAEFRNKLTAVMKMFPDGIPDSATRHLKSDEKKAIDDAEQAWKNLRTKVNSMGGLMK